MKSDNAEQLFNEVFERSIELTDWYEAEVISKALFKMCIEIEIFKKLAITEELKKLKTEIEEYMNISFGEDDDIKDGNIINIIDKHILELKGEQNDK